MSSSHAAHLPLSGKLLINKSRAYDVMAAHGIDGLVALNPINVYYIANTWVLGNGLGYEYPAFATFPRDHRQPSFLVTHALQGLEMSNGEREVPELIVMGGVANWQDYLQPTPDQMKMRPDLSPPPHFAVDETARLSPRERAWAEFQASAAARAAPSAAWALARALKDSGLANATVAVDDMRIPVLLAQIGMDSVKCVPGYRLFQQIRMVKSAPELEVMRIAGRNNAEATLATAKSISRGMSYADIERIFEIECAQRGNAAVTFIAGVSLAGLPDGVTVPGKPFLIDAVSHFHRYYGDFGRTVVIGEPSRDIVQREKAHKLGRDAALDIVKPGVTFSQLRRVAREAQVKAGIPDRMIGVAPHCVGLQHTDNPPRLDGVYDAPVDQVLEENMVLTIDLPLVEIGKVASHTEDLIRVTATGYEVLGPQSDPLIVV